MPLTIPDGIRKRLGPEIAPVYVLEFGSLQGDSISTRYSTGGVIPGVTLSPLIMDWPKTPSRTIDPLQGRSSIGTGSVTLQNQEGAIETLLSNRRMTSRPVSLYFLLDGVHWDERLQIYGGRVGNVSRTRDGLGFVFELKDNLVKTAKNIFQPADLQGESGGGAEKTWSIDSSIFGGGTLTLKDSDSDGTYDQVVLTGHPINIALCMLMSGSGEGGDYDVWPSWAGAAMTSDDVDVAAWEAARDDQASLYQYRVTLTGAERVKDFIEREVFKILGGYPVVTGSGKLSCQLFEAPRATDSLTSISDKDIFDVPDWDENHKEAITHIEFALDHDGSDFATTLPPFVSEQFLLGNVVDENRLKIESRGLQTDLGGIAACKAIAESIFRRYQSPPPRVRFSMMLWRMAVQGGDVIRLSSITYPNLERPEPLGFEAERLVEVHSVSMGRGSIQAEGLDLSQPLISGSKTAIIAPASYPDYTAATEAQKLYAYLVGADDNLLSNGDTGYFFS